MVPSITKGSSEFEGFEDLYVQCAWGIFESKSDLFKGDRNTKPSEQIIRKRAATFVTWFTKNKIFQQGDHFATIQQQLANRKKDMGKNNPEEWDTRIASRGIPAADFN